MCGLRKSGQDQEHNGVFNTTPICVEEKKMEGQCMSGVLQIKRVDTRPTSPDHLPCPHVVLIPLRRWNPQQGRLQFYAPPWRCAPLCG